MDEGTGTATDCNDFTHVQYLTSGTTDGQTLKSLKTALTSFSSTYPSGSNTAWAAPASSVASPAKRVFKITYWLPDTGEVGAPGSQATLDDLQNTTLATTFTWEAQNS